MELARSLAAPTPQARQQGLTRTSHVSHRHGGPEARRVRMAILRARLESGRRLAVAEAAQELVRVHALLRSTRAREPTPARDMASVVVVPVVVVPVVVVPVVVVPWRLLLLCPLETWRSID